MADKFEKTRKIKEIENILKKNGRNAPKKKFYPPREARDKEEDKLMTYY